MTYEDRPESTPIDEAAAEPKEPVTLKDRLIGLGMALAMLVLGVGMFIMPVLLPAEEISDVSRHRTRGWLFIVEMLWSRPVGVVLILLVFLLGMLVVWGVIKGEKISS